MCVVLAVQAGPTMGKGPVMLPPERTGGGFACQHAERMMPTRSLED